MLRTLSTRSLMSSALRRSPSTSPFTACVFTRVRGRLGSMTQASPSIRARAISTRLPETVQSRSRTLRLRYLLRCGRQRRTLRTSYAQLACDAAARAPSLRGLQNRALRDCPRRDIPPERDHQLAGDRHNANPPRACPLCEVPVKPLRKRTLRLPPHPAPRQLNAHGLQSRIPRPTDPLLPRRVAALEGRRRKPEQPANLPAILKFPPDEPFIEQHRCARRRHAFELHQLTRGTRRRGRRHRLLLDRVDFRDLRGQPLQPRLRAREARLHVGRHRGARPISHPRPPRATAPTGQRRAPDREPPAQLIHQPRLLLDQGRPLATALPCGFIGDTRDAHLTPHARFPVTDPHQHLHQFQGIEAIRLRPPRPPIHLNARRIHHPIPHAHRGERAMNPEPVATGLVAALHAGGCRQREPPPSLRERTLDRCQIPAAHRAKPRRHAEPRRHRQLPVPLAQLKRDKHCRLTYTHHRAGRRDHHSLLLASNTLRSLIARPAHSLSVPPLLCVIYRYLRSPPFPLA